jgi:hypothetical protein
MKNKKTLNTRGILSKFLFEQENTIAPSQTDPVEAPKNISLDQKVDKYLISYEKESVPTGKDYDVPSAPPVEATQPVGEVNTLVNPPPTTRVQGESFNKGNKRKLGTLTSILFEAEGEDPAAAGGDLGGADAGAEPPPIDATGDDSAPPATDMGGTEAPVIDTPKINLNNYAMGVARLVNNYEALLNPKATILGRAIEYIRVNYDDPTAKLFEEMLAQNFDLRVEEPERDQTMAPFAAGALVGDGGGGAAAG